MENLTALCRPCPAESSVECGNRRLLKDRSAVDGGCFARNCASLFLEGECLTSRYRTFGSIGAHGSEPGVSPALRPCMKIGAVPSAVFLQAG